MLGVTIQHEQPELEKAKSEMLRQEEGFKVRKTDAWPNTNRVRTGCFPGEQVLTHFERCNSQAKSKTDLHTTETGIRWGQNGAPYSDVMWV